MLGPLVHRGSRLVDRLGVIGPDDREARRYHALGKGSIVGFPRGAVFGEHWISVGSQTLIAPYVSMSVGMPAFQWVPHDPPVITIGDRCTIGRGSYLIGGLSIVIEDDVMTGPNVYITDHNHPYEDVDIAISQQWPPDEAPVRIGAGSWLGANVVVLPGADIGRHVTVAAGSVVRGTIPDRCVIAGAPAKIVRRHDEHAGWVPPVRSIDAPTGAVIDISETGTAT